MKLMPPTLAVDLAAATTCAAAPFAHADQIGIGAS